MKYELETSLDGVTWVKKPKLATESESEAVESFRLLKRTGDYPMVRIVSGGQVRSLYRADGRYVHSP